MFLSLSPTPLVGTQETTKPTRIDTKAGAATFIYAINLVLYRIRATILVINSVTINMYMINFARELKNFSYILCLVGPLIILLNKKYEIIIKIKFTTALIKKFFKKTPPKFVM